MPATDGHDQELDTDESLKELFDFDKAAEDNGFSTGFSTPAIGKADGEHQDAATDHASTPTWITKYVKPARPCDYCASRQLECFMSFGNVTCKACDSLFRSCSFAHTGSSARDTQRSNVGIGFTDTLCKISETSCCEKGGLTKVKTLKSMGGLSGSDGRRNGKLASSSSSALDGEKKAARFSKPQIRILRSWFENHTEHPYPTEEERSQLEKETGLKQGQIMTWLANTRRRSKLTKGLRPASSIVDQATGPIDMAGAENARPWSDVSLFQSIDDAKMLQTDHS